MDISNELEKEFEKYLKSIEQKCRQILEECILDVYMSYDPVQYIRTEQLLNSVNTKIEKNKLYVFIDTSIMRYYSAVDGRNVTEAVPYWINYGHHREIEGPIPMYDDYPDEFQGNFFIEVAAKRIKEELGVEVKIIRDKPPTV
jgi:hypothetical protein